MIAIFCYTSPTVTTLFIAFILFLQPSLSKLIKTIFVFPSFDCEGNLKLPSLLLEKILIKYGDKGEKVVFLPDKNDYISQKSLEIMIMMIHWPIMLQMWKTREKQNQQNLKNKDDAGKTPNFQCCHSCGKRKPFNRFFPHDQYNVFFC